MNWEWYYTLSLREIIFIGIFSLACVLYIQRVVRLAMLLNRRKRWIFIKLPLRIIYFTLLIITLLGPVFGYGKMYVETIGKDIYLAVDLSNSMNARDIAPSRLEKLKFELKNIVKALPDDRIGLIAFSEYAFLQSPLTHDKNALDLFIQSLDTETVPGESTNLAAPLSLALERLEVRKNVWRNYKSKIVVLATDGEDFGEDSEKVFRQYQARGIKVFTLGVGTTKGGSIPQGRGYMLSPDGQIAQTRLHYEPLISVARLTGGRYFEISANKNETPQLIQAIQNIKGERLDVKALDVSYNKYEYFLFFALGLICLDFVLTIKVLRL
ncbi:MAG: VWA domain-containing protein, partial [Bacteroidia bacterium]|nr:VWA domain-containing protein [Bacteroidia bacterium]